ncbi:MAG: hypothetical protein N2544_01655 [Burkholderiales bacterium]|nr:hypothetical protein [Burkholderiales bacterium]
MDMVVLIDALFEAGWVMALVFLAAGAALCLPDLVPHVGERPETRSPLHTETY